jgi:hypothetical protein
VHCLDSVHPFTLTDDSNAYTYTYINKHKTTGLRHLLSSSSPSSSSPPVYVITTKGKEFTLKLLEGAGLKVRTGLWVHRDELNGFGIVGV